MTAEIEPQNQMRSVNFAAGLDRDTLACIQKHGNYTYCPGK